MPLPLTRALVGLWVLLWTLGVWGNAAYGQGVSGAVAAASPETQEREITTIGQVAVRTIEKELAEAHEQRVQLLAALDEADRRGEAYQRILADVRELDVRVAQLEEARLASGEPIACVFIGPRPALDGDDPGAEYRRQLAELDLLVRVDRDFGEAARRLTVLCLRAMGPPAYEGQREVVTLATTRLVDARMAMRDMDGAADALDRMLERRDPASLDADEWFVVATPEWLAKERAWLADPRLEGQRKQVRSWREARQRAVEGSAPESGRDVAGERAGPAGPSLDALAEELMRDLMEGDGALLEAMGSAAVPALEHLTRNSTDIEPSWVAKVEKDPLYALMRTAPERALAVVSEDLDRAPLMWRKRVARAMKHAKVFALYRRDQRGVNRVLREHRWLDVLDELLADPAMFEDCTELLREQAQFSEWTETQAAAVRRYLDDAETLSSQQLYKTWPFYRGDANDRLEQAGYESVLGLRQVRELQHALDSSMSGVREYAAVDLKQHRLPTAFLGHLDPETPRVLQEFVRASYDAPAELDADTRARWKEAVTSLLSAKDDEVRVEAANLVTHPARRTEFTAEEIAPIVTDEVADIRRSLFRRFAIGSQQRIELTDGEVVLLRELLDDPDAEIRFDVLRVESARQQPTWLTRDELLARTKDASPKVRGALAWLVYGDPAVELEVYARLGADADREVVGAADSKIQHLVRNEDQPLERFLPYYAARLANAANPALAKDGVRGMPREFAALLPDGFAMTVHHVAARPGGVEEQQLLEMLPHMRRQWSSEFTAALSKLPAEDLAYLLHAMGSRAGEPLKQAGSSLRKYEFHREQEDLLELDTPSLAQATRVVSEDRTAHFVARAYAFAWRMRHRAAESRDAFLAFLHEPSAEAAGRAGDTDVGESHVIRVLATHIDGDVRNALCLTIVEDRAISDAIAFGVTRYYFPERDGGVDVSRAMAARWLQPGDVSYYGKLAIENLGGVAGEVDPAALREALRHPSLKEPALAAYGQRKDPALLPDLQEALNPTWIGYAEERHRFAKQVADTISRYMTDDAAEALLQGVGIAENEEIRQACFDGLERIRLYQEAQERLNRRDVGKEKRDEAVAELASMLSSDDAATVAAAAKGLAALGAVDELPALIRLMKHADASVRAAATEAVERLTASSDE